jgi:hypothetical protein
MMCDFPDFPVCHRDDPRTDGAFWITEENNQQTRNEKEKHRRKKEKNRQQISGKKGST